MKILQKIFDKGAKSACANYEKIVDDSIEGALRQPVTSLKILFGGVTCEAVGLTAKLTNTKLDKTEVRRSDFEMSGLFF